MKILLNKVRHHLPCISSLKTQYRFRYFSRNLKALWLAKSSNWIRQDWPYLRRYAYKAHEKIFTSSIVGLARWLLYIVMEFIQVIKEILIWFTASNTGFCLIMIHVLVRVWGDNPRYTVKLPFNTKKFAILSSLSCKKGLKATQKVCITWHAAISYCKFPWGLNCSKIWLSNSGKNPLELKQKYYRKIYTKADREFYASTFVR